MRQSKVRAVTCLLLLALMSASPGYSYSVLTHEAIIDSAWDNSIRVLLVERFPNATPEDLIHAHAYAYGGCILQDMGYYPFGNKFFSDLVHYARTGDFIQALIRDSQDLNEYAFSLGALAHYAADNNGHRIAINRAVPLLYPKLRAKFGDEVTYADDKASHLKTEFAFDVVQVARGRYAPNSYHSFIGFEVAVPLLGRAFQDTYSLELKEVITDLDRSVGSYRRTVSSILPEMTKVAWQTKKNEIRKDVPSATRRKFLYNLSRSSYEKEWGSSYQKPGVRARVLAFFFRIVPKVGPFKALAFHAPTPEAEKMFMASFDVTLGRYKSLLSELKAVNPQLPNENFDVGRPTKAGDYRLSDDTYAHLLDKLADRYSGVPQELREDILAFYRDLNVPIATKRDSKKWAQLLAELDQLKSAQPQNLRTVGNLEENLSPK